MAFTSHGSARELGWRGKLNITNLNGLSNTLRDGGAIQHLAVGINTKTKDASLLGIFLVILSLQENGICGKYAGLCPVMMGKGSTRSGP